MEIRPLRIEDLKQAIDLACHEYEIERSMNTDLYLVNSMQQLENLLSNLIQLKKGMAAVEEENLIGYLAFFSPFDGLNGRAKGVFSPLGGSAFSGEKKGKLASYLFEETSKMLMKEGVTSFAISRYAHDEEIAKSLVLNGFGIRCMDAICDLSQSKPHHGVEGITFHELEKSEFPLIKNLSLKLVKHLYQSPIYSPTDLDYFMSHSNLRIQEYLWQKSRKNALVTSNYPMKLRILSQKIKK